MVGLSSHYKTEVWSRALNDAGFTYVGPATYKCEAGGLALNSFIYQFPCLEEPENVFQNTESLLIFVEGSPLSLVDLITF